VTVSRARVGAAIGREAGTVAVMPTEVRPV
jgi:hypothetical protein